MYVCMELLVRTHRLLTASCFLPSLLFSAPPPPEEKETREFAGQIHYFFPHHTERGETQVGWISDRFVSFPVSIASLSFLFFFFFSISVFFYLLTGQLISRPSWSKSSSPSWLIPSRRSPIPEGLPNFICYVSIPTSPSLSPLLPLPPMSPSPSICASPPSPSCAPSLSPPGPRILTSFAAKS